MAWRKFLAVLMILSLSVGSAGPVFAFPHDPKPSSIDETGGWGPTAYKFNGFVGNYSNQLLSLGVDALRVLEFMNQEFLQSNGPGAPHDMKIWDTPSFTADKLDQDRATWQYLLEHPGAAVPTSVGRSLYTTHDEFIAYIESLPKTNMTVEYAGEIPRGFPYPVLIFSSLTTDRSPAGLRATKKPIVYVQGNIHGGEWSGGEGALAMAGALAKGKYDNLLKNVNVIIVPRICADGAKRPNRATRDLVALQWTATPDERDLNRDNLLLDLPITRINKKVINAYKPHFSVDLHERGSTSIADVFGRKIDTDAGDVGMSGTTILDTPLELTRLRYEETEPVIARVAQEHSIAQGLYTESACLYTHGNQNQFASAAQWTANWTANGHTTSYASTWSAEELPKIAPHAGAGYSGSMINNTAYDPDAPYRLRTDASFNTRSSRNINSLMGTVSQLFENKSGPTNVGNRGMWERRVATGYVCILGTITAAAEKSDWFMDTIESMRQRWIEKGKTVSTNDMIPILQLTPKPYFWNEGEQKVNFAGHNIPYRAIDITGLPSTIASTSIAAGLNATLSYDATKALKYVGGGNGTSGTKGNNFVAVTDESGKRGDHTAETAEMFKFTRNWLGYPLRERIRPYAYILEGPYAEEIATRMALNGIEVKRLAQDTQIEVEGWSYNQIPYVNNADSAGGGWRNRDVKFFPKTKTFKKDETFVVYLAQLGIHLIPMYVEPDAVYNAAACVMLPYMSLAMDGAGSGSLHPSLKDMEMPVYRYLKEANLPTYDMNVDLPLINRGAVARFFSFPTQEDVKDVADTINKSNIRVYNYDIQVHTRTDALVGAKFDMTLPTNADTAGYMIRKRDGTYAQLTPHATTMGYKVATVVVPDHGAVPYTVDMAPDNRPLVVDGNNRSLAQALPPNDDLIGVQVVEVLKDPTPDPAPEKKKSHNNRWSCGG